MAGTSRRDRVSPDTAIDNGDAAAAAPALRRELHAPTAVDPTIVGYLVEDAAILAIQQGDPRSGIRLLGASHGAHDRLGYRETPDEARRRHHWVDTARRQLDAAMADAAWDAGEALTSAEALDEARTVMAEPVSAAALSMSPTGNTFVREGDFWTLGFAGRVVRLKDSKGLEDIARLLATPGRGVAAVDLAAVAVPVTAGAQARVAELGLGVENGVGAILDPEARRQYRDRLVELEGEIGDAEANNDPERAGRVREEQAFLLSELGAAVGLGGKPRQSLDPAERARKAVTWRIRQAVGKIEATHPELGRHLRRSVRTGTFCVYDPPDATPWPR